MKMRMEAARTVETVRPQINQKNRFGSTVPGWEKSFTYNESYNLAIGF